MLTHALEEEGFLKIHVQDGTDRILGATIVARHAGEMINEMMVAGCGLKIIAHDPFLPTPGRGDSESRGCLCAHPLDSPHQVGHRPMARPVTALRLALTLQPGEGGAVELVILGSGASTEGRSPVGMAATAGGGGPHAPQFGNPKRVSSSLTRCPPRIPPTIHPTPCVTASPR